MPESLL
jgi:hypothetical protein